MRKTTASVLAALLVAGGIALPSAALADEATPVTDPVVTQEETTTPAPETETVTDPVVEEVKAEEAAPVVADPESKPSGPVAQTVQEPEESTPVEEDATPYVLVAWTLPGDVDDPIWPQQIKTHLDLATADLNALDDSLVTCGVDYQVDLYHDSAVTTALIAGGVLNGPSNPGEDLAHGAVKGNPWKYIDNDECEETPPPTTSQCETYGSVHTTNLVGSWALGESSTDGSAKSVLVDGGLLVQTEATGHRKAAGYYDVADFPLSDVSDLTMAFASGGSGSVPGGQVRVDVTGDGAWDFTLVDEDSANGPIVWASIPGGGTWVSQPWAPHATGGGGYPNQGTYDEWLAALWAYDDTIVPTVTQIGYSLGSGVTGSQVITSITVGCTEYTFDLPDLPEGGTVNGPWQYTVTCDNEVGDEVPATRTVTTTTWSRDENGQPVAASSQRTEDGTHVVTEEDLEGLECPTPTPTPTPTTTPTPTVPNVGPVVPASQGDGLLPQTGLGSDLAPLGWAGGIMLAAGLLVGLIEMVRRRFSTR